MGLITWYLIFEDLEPREIIIIFIIISVFVSIFFLLIKDSFNFLPGIFLLYFFGITILLIGTVFVVAYLLNEYT